MSRTGRLGYALFTASMLCLVGTVAFAQTKDEATDTYQVNYYSNALTEGAPDGTVHIVNPGTAIKSLDPDGKPTTGSLCADVYVLNNDEQVVECCGCSLSPDSERTLSINTNLLGNPVNHGNVTADGVIKVVSDHPVAGICRPDQEGTVPTAGLRAWATHIQAKPSTWVETEEEFSAAPLSDNELLWLQLQCSAIYTSGSGKGKCSCGTGD